VVDRSRPVSDPAGVGCARGTIGRPAMATSSSSFEPFTHASHHQLSRLSSPTVSLALVGVLGQIPHAALKPERRDRRPWSHASAWKAGGVRRGICPGRRAGRSSEFFTCAARALRRAEGVAGRKEPNVSLRNRGTRAPIERAAALGADAQPVGARWSRCSRCSHGWASAIAMRSSRRPPGRQPTRRG
jgi:hypothetical protein